MELGSGEGRGSFNKLRKENSLRYTPKRIKIFGQHPTKNTRNQHLSDGSRENGGLEYIMGITSQQLIIKKQIPFLLCAERGGGVHHGHR